MSEPKRVILRVREDQMDYSDTYKPVRLYFSKFNRSLEELESDRHFIHIQPPSDLSQPGSKIHVVIDLEKDKFSGKFSPGFPHDIYTIRCVENEMNLCAFKDDTVKKNLLLNIRQFTDELYPWGKTRLDHLREARLADG